MSDTPEQNQSPTGSKGSGLEPNIAGALCYLCGWLTGLIFILVEKDNKEVRFHAWHSVFLSLACFVYFGATFILSFIPFLGIILGLINVFVMLGVFVLMILNMVKAFQGSRLSLPVITDLAQQQADK